MMQTPSGELAAPLSRGWALTRAAVCVLVAAWGLSSLWYPFGWDQGIFAWVGASILDGAMPYRDAFDIKGPVAHLIYAGAQAAFGQNLWGIRLLDLIVLGSVAWLTSKLLDRVAGRGAGVWGAALLVLWYAGLTFWHTAQPDGFAAWILALGIIPMLRSEGAPSLGRSLACGACLGLTIAIKPTYAAFALVPAVLIVGRVPIRRSEVALRLGAVALGAVLVVGVITAWFAARGALSDLWDVYVRYNATAYSSGGALAVQDRLRGTFEYVLTGNVFVVLLPAMLLGTVRLWTERRTDSVAIVGWSVIAFGTVVLQNKFFDYQWAPLIPPAVILGVVGLWGELRDAAERGGSWLGRNALGHALALVILVHASVHPAFEVMNWATHVTGLRDDVAYYDTFGVPGNDLRMARHIESVASETDRLLVMAWNIEILYMTGLQTVSRFGYSLPLWMGEGTSFRGAYRQEFMSALRETPPEFVIVGAQAEPLLGRPVSLDEFPEFHGFLRDAYVADVSFGDLQLYRLRQATP